MKILTASSYRRLQPTYVVGGRYSCDKVITNAGRHFERTFSLFNLEIFVSWYIVWLISCRL